MNTATTQIWDAKKEYREWLINKVNTVEDYTFLLRELFSIDFYYIVKYDEDRGADGLALRDGWAESINYKGSLEDFGVANVLEVLIGIAIRIEFQLFGTKYAYDWDYVRIFWDLIDNLGLGNMHGTLSRYDFDEIHEIVTLFLKRDYFRHKKCNIFKIDDYGKDHRKLNIWAQMGLYIRERWPK